MLIRLRFVPLLGLALLGLGLSVGVTACSDAGGGPGSSAVVPSPTTPPASTPPPITGADGGATDGAAPAPSCDDGNPCTIDRTGDRGCEHDVVPDGTACDDGAGCTTNDHCHWGECVATDVPPHVARRGSFVGFGAAPNEDGSALAGLAEVVSDRDILFADPIGTRGLSLSLVRATSKGLERLDRKDIHYFLERYNGGWDWSERPATFFIPLGADRTLLVATRQGIELFDTAQARITPITSFGLHPASDTILAGVGRGAHFYTCSLHVLSTWQISPANEIVPIGKFPTPDDCRSLALSADGTELLIASTKGIARADVSTPKEVTFKSTWAPRRDFFRVDVGGDIVVGQRQGWYGELRDIEVYRRSSLELDPLAAPIEKFKATAASELPSRLPIGFAILDGSLAIEWKRSDGIETTYTTEVQTLPGVAPRSSVLVHRRSREDRLTTSPFALAHRGSILVVPPWRTVVRDDPSNDSLTALTGPEQAGFDGLSPRGLQGLTGLSALGIHEVDLHNPDAPVVKSAALPASASFLRWEPNGASALTSSAKLAGPGGLRAVRDPTPATCLRRDASGALAIAGDVALPGQGYVADLGRAMLQVTPEQTPGAFSLRWFDAPASCDGRTLAPVAQGAIDLAPGDGRPRVAWAFDGDGAGAQTAVVVEIRGPVSGPTAGTLAWIEWEPGGSGWKIAARLDLQETPSFVAGLRARGNVAVFHDGRQMFVARRIGTQITIVAQREILDGAEQEELVDILRFDGELVFVATRKRPIGVVVLRARDLERFARFETYGVPRAMVQNNGQIAFGSASALDVVDSLCSP